jgi:tetratricopeptide (TPR) repeat protein
VSQSDFVTRGQSLVAAGQYQEAVKVCRLGLLGRPTTVEGRVVLGQALLALKRFDEVLAEMRVALELDHTSIAAQVLKGEAMLRKGDAIGAVEVLSRVRAQAPTDLKVAELLAEAEKAAGRPRLSAVHPSVGFVSPSPAGPPPNPFATKAYLPPVDDEDTGPEEDTEGSFTRPTSLSAPAAKKRNTPQPLFGGAAANHTPPPNVLAVGDRSGTVEVDPELDGVEVAGDDDFGEPAAPPSGGKRAKPDGRGAILPAARSPKPQPVKAKKKGPQKEISTVELEDDEMVELDETFDPIPVKKGQSPKSAVRAAVKMPSGPLRTSDDVPQPISPMANRPTAHQPVPQPPAHLAALIANQPNPRSQIAAAQPTVAAPMPAPPPGYPMAMVPPPANPFAQTMMPMQPMPSPAAALPTMALPAAPGPGPGPQMTAAQMQSAAAVDAMFASGDPFAVAAPHEPTAQPQPPPVNPALAAMFDNIPAVSANDSINSQSNAKAMKTGIRRRSRLVITLWAFLGVLVIGIGVGAGLWIRALRLEKQIDSARKEAVDLAKADTWKGWSGARDRLAGIAQASGTVDNRAALARTRALVAFEFGDGYADAKQAVDGLGEAGGVDTQLATVYVALAEGNSKAARTAAEAAMQSSSDDAAVMYAQGNAQLAAGDTKGAITTLKKAAEKEVRPLYLVGLARAYEAATMWDEAIQTTERAIALTADHPGGVIERAVLAAKSGRIISTTTLGTELRGQLERIVAEETKPLAEQPRGISRAQVAFAHLALARVDYARGDVNAAQTDVKNALKLDVDQLRFAEEVVDVIYTTGSLAQARTAAETVLEKWPDSRRARTTLAEVFLSQGKNVEALETLAKMPESQYDPRAFAVRAQTKIANGDPDGARKDYEDALKRAPTLESALVGLAWLDLKSDPKDIDAARKRIEPRIKDNAPPPPALAAVYAAILRASGDAGDREKAKGVLENAVKGAKSLDTARAQLELARLYREIGGIDELRAARAAYEAANALPEARFESALLAIEDRDPRGGRETLEVLLKDAGDKAQAPLLLEVARARLLTGDHAGAAQLFPTIEKAPGVVKWQLERERARYLLRKADYAGAVQSLSKAIEECGDDIETFLLAADAAYDGDKPTRLLERIKVLAPKKLQGKPEAKIVEGKLALVQGDYPAAQKAYEEAKKQFGDKATNRRIAQATYGKGVSAYYQKDDPNARNAFELATEQDPSIFSAYLFLGDMVKEKDPKQALELARKSVTYNPDFVEGWVMLGTVASRLRDKKQRAEAITRVGELAPNSEALRTLQALP